MKLKKKILIVSFMMGIMMFGLQASVLSYDLPFSTIQDAIKTGETMFVGRIVGIEEVQHNDYTSLARAKVRVIHCFFGIPCQKDDELVILYYSDTLEENVCSVEFSISREILFVLRQRPTENEEYMFDSRLKGGVDSAFIVDVEDVLTNFKNRFFSDTDSIRLTDIYRENKEWLSRVELEKMVQGKIKPK